MNVDVAELDERIAKCQKILETDPNSQIFAALADAYRKKGVTKKALDICHKGLQLHPYYASAYIVMVKIFLEQGNYEEADRQLQKAISVGGRTRSVDILEAEILIKRTQYNKARTMLERLLKSDPGNETIKNLLISIDEEEKRSSAKSFSSLPVPSSEKRSYSLSNALNIIKVLPRVVDVLAVSRDGMIVEGQFHGLMTLDEFGALATDSFFSISQGIGKIDLGEPQEIMIESEKSKLWIINRGRILIVISMREDVNLGSLRLKVNDILNQVEFS